MGLSEACKAAERRCQGDGLRDGEMDTASSVRPGAGCVCPLYNHVHSGHLCAGQSRALSQRNTPRQVPLPHREMRARTSRQDRHETQVRAPLVQVCGHAGSGQEVPAQGTSPWEGDRARPSAPCGFQALRWRKRTREQPTGSRPFLSKQLQGQCSLLATTALKEQTDDHGTTGNPPLNATRRSRGCRSGCVPWKSDRSAWSCASQRRPHTGHTHRPLESPKRRLKH